MANQDHVEALAQGIDAWRLWRGKHPHITPDLSGVEITDQDLAGIDLHSAMLRESILTNVNFTGADFQGADLTEADLSDSDLDQATLARAATRGASFARANLDGAVFNGCDLGDCNFDEAEMINVEMIGADLSDLDLSGRTLSGALLRNANLSGADLRGAICVAAEFTNANLSRAGLQGADLEKADLAGTNLTAAGLRGANLSYASLAGATVTEADFSGARIHALNAFDLTGNPASQFDLVITPRAEASIETDNFDIARLIYLLSAKPSVRALLKTASARTVLIVGEFATADRRGVLDALRAWARASDFVPVFYELGRGAPPERPEFLRVVAQMSALVIMDLTGTGSPPETLLEILQLGKVPVLPLPEGSGSAIRAPLPAPMLGSSNGVIDSMLYESSEALREILNPALLQRLVNARREPGAGPSAPGTSEAKRP